MIALGRESPEGICSRLVIDLDGRTYVDRNFERLQKLVEDNPEDPLILWLLCIECREHRRNELGAQSYKRLSVFFDPGPVLFHQTYANILDEGLGRYEEALLHRRLAVEMEPRGWTCSALAGTLVDLRRWDEAFEAYEKSTELAPEDSDCWSGWGWALGKAGRYDEAFSKLEKAAELDPSDAETWRLWGRTLAYASRHEEALEKYRIAADLGSRGAMNNIGVMYHRGTVVKKDGKEALRWYRKAAARGDSWALGNIGDIYKTGLGVKQNHIKAVEFYRKGAQAGEANSLSC